MGKILSILITLFLILNFSLFCVNKKQKPDHLPSPSHWKSAYVNANGINLHYIRTGGEKPVIVLAHGITDNSLCWSRVARALEKDYDVIMYDARGHGLSEVPAEGYDAETFAEDLAELITSLGLKRPILMGHSMGAGTVALVAVKYPDWVRGIILEDPVGLRKQIRQTNDVQQRLLEKRREEIHTRNKMSLEELIELCRTSVHQNWTNTEDLEHWAIAKQQASPNIAALWVSLPDIYHTFTQIQCPVLILKADTKPADRKVNEEITNILPNGKIIHVDGAGHNVRRDNFERFMAGLRPFLKSLEAN